jgi:hypothetical protein
MRRSWLPAGAALALAGCAGTIPPPAPSRPSGVSAPARPAPTRVRPSRAAPRTAAVMTLPGLEGVIGASAEELSRQFGAPRLDIVEGDARKLQFSASACVLDAYLYPPAAGSAPRTTYIDARRADGQDVDRAACVAALRRR